MGRAAKYMKHSFRVFKHSRDAITSICASISIEEFNSRMFRYGHRPESHHCMFCMHWTFHMDGNYPRMMSDSNLVMFFCLSYKKNVGFADRGTFWAPLSPEDTRSFGQAWLTSITLTIALQNTNREEIFFRMQLSPQFVVLRLRMQWSCWKKISVSFWKKGLRSACSKLLLNWVIRTAYCYC